MSALSEAGYAGIDAQMRALFVWSLYEMVRPMTIRVLGVSVRIATFSGIAEQIITRMVGPRPQPQ
jgi:hypothetical protein